LGLEFSLGVENADAIQEAFKLTRPRPVLLVASWPFHNIDRMTCFPLLAVALGRVRLVHVAWVFFLSLFPGVKGRHLDQGLFVSDGEHCFWRLGVLHGDLMDQGWVHESLLEEHYDRLVIDCQDDIPIVAEMLDELPDGHSLILDDAG
jgi:hypothetical protein